MNKLNKLQQRISSFVSERDWEQFHSPKNLSMALNVETAELMEHFQWLNPENSKKSEIDSAKFEEIEAEIGDIFIYSLMFCEAMDIDPLEAIEEKIEVNEDKYPVEKAKGSAQKYTDFSEEE